MTVTAMRGQPVPAAQGAGKIVIRPVVVILLLCITFQFTFDIGSLLMSPARSFLLLATPVLLIRMLSGRYGKINAVDILVFAHVAWTMLMIFVHHPVGIAITYTGSNAILILGGYLVARTMIRSAAEMRGMIVVLVALIVMSLAFALVETRTSVMSLARLIDLVPGVSASKDVNYEPRMGFHRVQFTFVHPIHYGLFCSVGFAFCILGLRSCLRGFALYALAGAIAVTTFLSLSSGPFLSLSVTIVVLLVWRLSNGVKNRWKTLTVLLAVSYVALELASDRPAIYAIVSKLSFAPHTANLRLLLFDYGIDQVWRAPLLGIGFHPFPLPDFMSGSIDNHWLLQCIVFGLPAFVLLMAALTCLFVRLARLREPPKSFNDLRVAWTVTMVSLLLTLATVAIWGETLTLFYFIIGSGVWMADGPGQADASPARAGQSAPMDRGLRFTRFPHRPRS